MTLLLAGDIGGTKTLLSLWRPGGERPELVLEERYASADWPDLVPMVRDFLAVSGPLAGGVPAAARWKGAGPGSPTSPGCSTATASPVIALCRWWSWSTISPC
jgi:hypothetical protein